MADPRGWEIDRTTLRAVATDPSVLAAQLPTADPITTIFLLRLLDRPDEAYELGVRILAEPDTRTDPWRALLMHADTLWLEGDFETAATLQEQAWSWARSRSRQATTMQHVGKRWANYGDIDRAAGFFTVALTLRRGFGDAELIESSTIALERVRELSHYDAIVLAGGSGVRFGRRDKPAVPLAGWPLIDHVLIAASSAQQRLVVGPARISLADPVFCREDPVGSGPVAAVAAAIDRVRAPMVAVLAADVPFIGPGLNLMRDALAETENDAAAYVDLSGRTNYLAAVWRTSSLRAALARIGDPTGVPMRALSDDVRMVHQPDFDALAADCDTPNDLAAAEQRIKPRTPGQLPATPLAWPGLDLAAPS